MMFPPPGFDSPLAVFAAISAAETEADMEEIIDKLGFADTEEV